MVSNCLTALYTLYLTDVIVNDMPFSSIIYDKNECAFHCHEISNCASFFYDPANKKCLFYDGGIPQTDSRLVPGSGVLYYATDKAYGCLQHNNYQYEPGGYCLRYETSKTIWTNARDICASEGGTLVKIESSEKQAFFASLSLSLGNFWLGGNDLDVEGTWRWQDGTPITGYEKWHINEPDGGTVQNCMSMLNQKWGNGGCSDNKVFICEVQI